MKEINILIKGKKIEKYSNEKWENDIKWRNFVTKRDKMGVRQTDHNKIREILEKIMNPFSQELVVEVDVRLSPNAKIVDPVYGEVPATSDIEKAKSTKIYKTAELRNRTMNLSATAQRMLLFIVYEIEGSDDWITLDPKWYKEASGSKSPNMYKKGKDELIRYGYITPTECKYTYWVNPVLMFGGNRIRKYPDKVVVKNTFTGKTEVNRKPKQSDIKLGKKQKWQTED